MLRNLSSNKTNQSKGFSCDKGRYCDYSHKENSNITNKSKLTLICFLALIIMISLVTVSCENSVIDELREESDPFWYIGGSLREGETLAQSLQAKGIGHSRFHPVINRLDDVYNLRRAMPADSFFVQLDSLGVIHRFSYHPSRERIRYFSVLRDTLGNYYTTIDTIAVTKILKKTEGTIKNSLYGALREFGEGPHLINQFAEIFQWDIDFLLDQRAGDRFSLVYEQYMQEDNFVKYGNILVAEYESRSYHKRAYRFEIDNDHSKYYDKEGGSFQKAFLRSPLNYTRISSHFSKGRYHPVLKIVRPHNGVDYAAPSGTPVVAASDGVVTHAAWKGGHPTVNGQTGGYGRTVMIRHSNGYETLYGHLNNYGPGIRRGVRVSQNQVIGYVGQTGLATGPHLHYTVYHHGTAIDPLKMKNVAGPPVPQEKMERFREAVVLYDGFINGEAREVIVSIPLLASHN